MSAISRKHLVLFVTLQRMNQSYGTAGDKREGRMFSYQHLGEEKRNTNCLEMNTLMHF